MKTLGKIGIAGACSILANAAAAQSTVTIYGGLDGSVESNNAGLGTRYRLVSGGAVGNRLGFRGSEDLGNGLSAVFRLEMGIAIDTGALGQGGRAFGREAFVGLSDKTLGTVVLGRVQLPYYIVARAVDAFGWVGSGGALTSTYGPGAAQVQPLGAVARSDNAARYDSPTWGGFVFRGMLAAGEGSPQIGRATSFGATYTAGGWDLTLGWAEQKGADNAKANGTVDAVVAGGSYDFKVAKVFAGFNRERNDCRTCTGQLARSPTVSRADFRVINIGTRVPLSPDATLIAQVLRIADRSDYPRDPGNRDVYRYSLGGEYYLSKRTNFYSTVATLKNKNGSQYNIGNGTVPQLAGSVGTNSPRATTFLVGLRHFF